MESDPEDRQKARLKKDILSILEEGSGPLESGSHNERDIDRQQANDQLSTATSPEEALDLITKRGLEFAYPDHPKLFKTWWRSIPSAMKREINSRVEDFDHWQEL